VIRQYSTQEAADHAPFEAELRAIEAELRAVDALASSEQRFRLAFEQSMAGTILVDLEDKVLEVNDAFCQMVGRNRDEIVAKRSELFTHPEDRCISDKAHHRLTSGELDQVSYTKRYLRKNGQVIVVEVSKSAVRDATGSTLYFVTSVRDVTKEHALSTQLSHQALHDSLTGLPNRVLFENRLSQAHARTARRGGWNAVMLLDLDDFKEVNDSLGHLVGDELLVALARRFEEVTRSTDTLCRFGGDEFIYLAEELASPAQAEEVAERLLGVLAKPFSLAGTQVQQHASIGAVVLEGTGKAWTELIQDADAALYEAKRQGKGRHVLFTSTMRQQAVMLGRVLGNSGQRLALSPPADPPLVRSGADTPRSSDTANWDRLNSRSGSPVPLRRYGSVEDVGGSLEAALESRQIPLDGPDRAWPVVIGHDGTR
jgi:diguanylate cyclase (GGDEF)-like protein/PAS domain S-box-containing protein